MIAIYFGTYCQVLIRVDDSRTCYRSHCLCQCHRRSAVEASERLMCAVVDRHSRLDPIAAYIEELYA
jgi:hypothetical protein